MDVIYAALLLITLISSEGKRSDTKKNSIIKKYEELKDVNAVVSTMCDVRCRQDSQAEAEMCHKKCLLSTESKPGTCPSSFRQLSIFAKACLHVCSHDFQCPGTDKCCRHSCGVTCQPAEMLGPHLPPVPRNVTAREHRGNGVVQIGWTLPATDSIDGNVMYLIENRSHFGKLFDEESLGPWTPFYQATNNPSVIKGVVLTAHWYVFRVASVSANGTRGFSLPSAPLFISKTPAKPGPPKRLGVTNVREINNTVWALLRWKRPKSDVPIKSYRIYWSWRLPGNSSESLMRRKHTQPMNQMTFQLENLRKNELYYIQVHAIAVFGNEKIRGVKGELFFNTTLLHDQYAKPMKGKHAKISR